MALTLVPAGSAQGDTLVEGDVIADNGGLPDDHPHAVVNKKATADGGAGVDLDARQPPRKGGNASRQPLEIRPPYPVGKPVEQQRVQSRVVGQNLECVPGSRVPVEHTADVLFDSLKHLSGPVFLSRPLQTGRKPISGRP